MAVNVTVTCFAVSIGLFNDAFNSKEHQLMNSELERTEKDVAVIVF